VIFAVSIKSRLTGGWQWWDEIISGAVQDVEQFAVARPPQIAVESEAQRRAVYVG
jgi:hypothetical protein